MCNDHVLPTRRSFLRGTGVLAGAALLAGHGGPASAAARPRPRPSGRPVDPFGNGAYSNAMHIHSSFSEMDASMGAQLYQAAHNSVDVLWWTDHNERFTGLAFPTQFHFTSFTEKEPGRGPWNWVAMKSGHLVSCGGGIVTSPSSPNDPVSGGSLKLSAQSKSMASASYGFYIDCSGEGYDYRASLSGQSFTIDVMLPPSWTHGHMELLVTTSVQAGPTGNYSLSYRMVPGKAGGQRKLRAAGTQGIVSIPVVADGRTWTTVTVTPCDDIAALWPSMNAQDFGCYEIRLNAVSTGDAVLGYFDWLRFSRATAGELRQKQQQIGSALAPAYPSVTQQHGLELSWLGGRHVNWYGPKVQVQDYPELGPTAWLAYLRETAVPLIHSSGGLASYNHAFGVIDQPLKSPSEQARLVASTAASLLPSGGSPAVLGCDILEVGYNLRAGMPLASFTALWDIFSRNAVFLTGNGVSDDHHGKDWLNGNGSGNNWATSTWAASTAQSDLLAALTAGKAYCGSLTAVPVALDLLVDNEVPMGGVSVSSLTSRSLTVTAAGLPSGSTLQVLQADVDYAGTRGLSSNAVQVASFTPGELDGSGQATFTVDTSTSGFLRTEVVDSTGTVQALSNPVWLLDASPPNGIPGPRQA